MAKPWFRIMRPEQANTPDSQWVRHGAASRGKVVVLPIAWEGWAALIGFVVLLVVAGLGIWLGGYLPGGLSVMAAIVLTFLVEAAIVVGFILLMRARSTRT